MPNKKLQSPPFKSMKKLYAFSQKRSLDLSLSENPLGCSPLVFNVLRKNNISLNNYPKTNGLNLKKALAKKLAIKKNMFFIANGSESIISAIPRILTKPGDEVIIPQLTFPLFETCSRQANLKIKIIKMKTDLKIDLNSITQSISAKTKLIFICNPNNPTGNILSKKEITDFLDKISSSILVVLDEANIEFGGKSLIEEIIKRQNLVILRTFSKGFGLASLRVGFAIASELIVNKLENKTNVFPISGLSEKMAIEALQDDEFLQKTKKFMDNERNFLTKALTKANFKIFPSEANNLFVKLPNSLNMESFWKEIELADISLVKGNNFLGFDNKFFRISPRTKEINKKFIKILTNL